MGDVDGIRLVSLIPPRGVGDLRASRVWAEQAADTLQAAFPEPEGYPTAAAAHAEIAELLAGAA